MADTGDTAGAEDSQTDDPPRGRFAIRAADGLAGGVLFALMAMTCIDVIGRELLGAPLDGATELTMLMLGVIIFAVLPTVSLREEHVTVDLFDKFFPQRFVPHRAAILHLVMAVVMGVLCWRVGLLAWLAADYGDATEFLEIPLAPITYFIAVMSGLTALALFANAIKYFRRIKTHS